MLPANGHKSYYCVFICCSHVKSVPGLGWVYLCGGGEGADADRGHLPGEEPAGEGCDDLLLLPAPGLLHQLVECLLQPPHLAAADVAAAAALHQHHLNTLQNI